MNTFMSNMTLEFQLSRQEVDLNENNCILKITCKGSEGAQQCQANNIAAY